MAPTEDKASGSAPVQVEKKDKKQKKQKKNKDKTDAPASATAAAPALFAEVKADKELDDIFGKSVGTLLW